MDDETSCQLKPCFDATQEIISIILNPMGDGPF